MSNQDGVPIGLNEDGEEIYWPPPTAEPHQLGYRRGSVQQFLSRWEAFQDAMNGKAPKVVIESDPKADWLRMQGDVRSERSDDRNDG